MVHLCNDPGEDSTALSPDTFTPRDFEFGKLKDRLNGAGRVRVVEGSGIGSIGPDDGSKGQRRNGESQTRIVSLVSLEYFLSSV